MKKKTTEQFIEEAKKIHGDKYDYSLVDYKDAKTKVKIICKDCGNIFEQDPDKHLQKRGCPFCKLKTISQKLTKTTEQFIEEAKKIHGDKYDYSLVDYKKSNKNVKIICNTCGKCFLQTPRDHLRKHGCLFCYNNFTKTTEQFIEEAKKIHGDKYDYSLVDYKNNHTKVKIRCKVCNKYFLQTAGDHLNGKGCMICGRLLSKQKRTKTTEQFIKEAKEIHGDKYNYSLVDYKSRKEKVKIICNTCGKCFLQTPANHLKKSGCPTCCESHGEKAIINYFKKYNIEFEREKKFKDCKNKRPFPFDFYLSKLNTCIEYDGEQHFKPIKIWGGEKQLKITQENDKIKTDYCLKNHIRIIRIRYWETVEDILDLYFKNYKPA